MLDFRRSWLPHLHAYSTDWSLVAVGNEEHSRWRVRRSKVIDLAAPGFRKVRQPLRNWPPDFVKCRRHVLEDEISRIGQLTNCESIDDFKGGERIHRHILPLGHRAFRNMPILDRFRVPYRRVGGTGWEALGRTPESCRHVGDFADLKGRGCQSSGSAAIQC